MASELIEEGTAPLANYSLQNETLHVLLRTGAFSGLSNCSEKNPHLPVAHAGNFQVSDPSPSSHTFT